LYMRPGVLLCLDVEVGVLEFREVDELVGILADEVLLLVAGLEQSQVASETSVTLA